MIILIATLLITFTTIAYVIANYLTAAYLWRNSFTGCRKLITTLTNQFHKLSLSRIWITVILHVASMAFLCYFLTRPQEILWITLVLLGYAFFVSTLTLSLLMRLPYVKKLWEDTFFKVSMLAIPILLLYLAKGYAALWIGEIFHISASNVPMAHFAATSFFLLLAVSLGLSITALFFELAFVIFMPSDKRMRIAVDQPNIFPMLFSLRPYRRRTERVSMRIFQKSIGMFFLLLASFFGTYMGFYAAASIAPGQFSRIIVSAIVFEFDAAPADRCTLTPKEKLKVQRDEPLIKALFLAGSQDKAILVERQKNLFAPIRLQGFRARTEKERDLSMQRTTECNTLSDKVSSTASVRN